jgi:hypothetical protein
METHLRKNTSNDLRDLDNEILPMGQGFFDRVLWWRFAIVAIICLLTWGGIIYGLIKMVS